ncbi:MAG: hypothetical protein QOK05_1635 [Chloroflexota bacterium]|jgi:hypothetical protein|nr:hypothetical protein [Chloroflexota bacterium]
MKTHPRQALIVIMAGLALTACGGPGPSSGCVFSSCAPSGFVPPGSPSPVSATDHGWTTTVLVVSDKVQVRVTVVGPLSVDAGCAPTLTTWLVRADGTKIEPSPGTGVRCQAIVIDDIAAGQTRDYSLVMDAPRERGTYTLHGLVRLHLPIGAGARVSENVPVVTVQVP